MKRPVIQRRNQGFLLLTFCVYLICSSLLLAITIPFTFNVFQIMLSIAQKNRVLQGVDLLFSVVTNELCEAPARSTDFKQLHETEVIWSSRVNQDQDIGLVYDQPTETLFRIQGIYDTEKKRWSSKRRSLVAKSIRVAFNVMNASSDITFVCTVYVDSFTFTRTITPQNRTYKHKKINSASP